MPDSMLWLRKMEPQCPFRSLRQTTIKVSGNWLAKDWTKHRLDSPRVIRPNENTFIYEFGNGTIETNEKS